jgi:hypothetical protein
MQLKSPCSTSVKCRLNELKARDTGSSVSENKAGNPYPSQVQKLSEQSRRGKIETEKGVE